MEFGLDLREKREGGGEGKTEGGKNEEVRMIRTSIGFWIYFGSVSISILSILVSLSPLFYLSFTEVYLINVCTSFKKKRFSPG